MLLMSSDPDPSVFAHCYPGLGIWPRPPCHGLLRQQILGLGTFMLGEQRSNPSHWSVSPGLALKSGLMGGEGDPNLVSVDPTDGR